MINAIAVGISAILFGLSAVHWYWLAGGTWGIAAAVPRNGTEPLFKPSNWATGAVAAALGAAGWLTLELGHVLGEPWLPGGLLSLGGWMLSGVFLLRAVGDFRWLGLFKKRRDTLFAKWDTLLFTPLCLLIGLGAGLLTAL